MTLAAPLPPLREESMTDVTVVIIDRDLLFSRGLERWRALIVSPAGRDARPQFRPARPVP